MINNLFESIDTNCLDELTEPLVDQSNIRIERIVSTGQTTPDGDWYDQEQHEWVCVLSGEARLRFEGEAECRLMTKGDYLIIPAHQRHRVEWTTPEVPTVWIAVFYGNVNECPPA